MQLLSGRYPPSNTAELLDILVNVKPAHGGGQSPKTDGVIQCPIQCSNVNDQMTHIITDSIYNSMLTYHFSGQRNEFH